MIRTWILVAVASAGFLRVAAQEPRRSAQVTLIARVPDTFAVYWKPAHDPTSSPSGASHSPVRVIAHLIPGTSVSIACMVRTHGNLTSAPETTKSTVFRRSGPPEESTSNCEDTFPPLPPDPAQAGRLVGAQSNSSGIWLDIVVSAI